MILGHLVYPYCSQVLITVAQHQATLHPSLSQFCSIEYPLLPYTPCTKTRWILSVNYVHSKKPRKQKSLISFQSGEETPRAGEEITVGCELNKDSRHYKMATNKSSFLGSTLEVLRCLGWRSEASSPWDTSFLGGAVTGKVGNAVDQKGSNDRRNLWRKVPIIQFSSLNRKYH